MPTESTPALAGLTPYLHVGDLEGSIRFYESLGFSVVNEMEREGRLFWAMLQQGAARLMLAQAAEPVDRHAQGVLFYLYTDDLAALRAQLMQAGVAAGEITTPPHMPFGELRIDDPDGYCLLIGQLEAST